MLRTSRSIQQGRMIPYYSTADLPKAFDLAGLPSIWAAYESGYQLYTTSSRTTAATADGNDVGSMTDKTLQTHHLNAGTPATLKTAILGSLPVVRFNGSNDYLLTSNTGLTGAAAWTVTMCFKSVSSAQYGTLWSLGAYGTAYQIFGFQQGTSASELQINSWGGSTTIGDTSVDFSAAFHIVTVLFDGTNLKMYVDGALKSNDTSNYTSMNLVDAPLRVGGQAGGYAGFYGNIDVQSCYFMKAALGDADRQALEGYISGKTGITLS